MKMMQCNGGGETEDLEDNGSFHPGKLLWVSLLLLRPFVRPSVRSVSRAKIAHFTQSSFFKTAIAVRSEDGSAKKAAAPHRKRLQVKVFSLIYGVRFLLREKMRKGNKTEQRVPLGIKGTNLFQIPNKGKGCLSVSSISCH